MSLYIIFLIIWIKRKVHFTHLWFGLFTNCLSVVSKLTLYLPEVLYINYLLTSVTHVGLPLKPKQNKNHSFSLVLVTDFPLWNSHASPYTWDFGILALGFVMTIIPYFSFLCCEWLDLIIEFVRVSARSKFMLFFLK